MRKLQLFFTLSIITFSAKSQELALNSSITNNTKISFEIPDTSVNPILEEATYTYNYNGDNVLVVFTDNKHIEYFNNKKYFIKSNLIWTSNDECSMTIEESNLPNFPFKSGDKLSMKIKKIKRGYIYYESILAGRSWTGKMKKIK